MPLFWVLLWLVLPPLTLLSHPDGCIIHDSDTSRDVLMELLQCHNDYESYVYCKWGEGPHIRAPLQLWFHTERSRERCENFGVEVRNADGHRTVQCRYETHSFSIGINHTVFFVEDDALCSSAPRKPLKLSDHVRARTPVDLSKYDTGDGQLWIKWSSPYPASSSLNKNLMYQVGYKAERQDTWTFRVHPASCPMIAGIGSSAPATLIMNVTSTDVKLETRLLLPGHRYEARVRGWAGVGQWSHWSPVVMWRTKEDSRHFPSLYCVLDGEDKVMCSWEVSRALDHVITYQLACQHNHTAPSESCCENQTVTFDPSRPLVRYSCWLTVARPAQLLLKLQPTRNAKTFRANKHIRPRPPQQVRVGEKGNNWMVDWTEPSTASKIRLYYQVRYYKTQDKQGSSLLLNISEGSTSVSILGPSLSPSQHHRVQVRSVVIPGQGSLYEGSPSEWSEPADWTSHAATWPLTTTVYFCLSATVAIIFLILLLYCTISSCQRKIIIWVGTVPSPGKSKTLSEIKSATSWALIENENTYMSKVEQLYSLATCTSQSSSLWPTEGAENKDLEQDRQDYKSNSLTLPAEKFNGCDLPMHFSGPYILCQREQNHQSADNPVLLDIRPDSSDPPPAYSSESAWPTIMASGYCLLPPPS
ncbi:cytokine receptor common subunit beta isoform X5 [Phycodurus eques]|uniref:cytokine receptor common subunit beta isoform X5 n=1 Tax=Phycodurus eques TaxID=693459 RepID=UPI002ACEF08F|nr:cytokine receptor common subunit beta isoform X5 [Phycodurus eques]